MEGAGGGSSSLMAFGENSHGLSPMLMMPPTVDSCNNNLFLPPAHHQDLINRHGSLSVEGSSSMMLEEQHNSNISTSTGYYLMENINDAGSGSVKAKIIAHPYYQRLLAAYVNCQKTTKTKSTNFFESIFNKVVARLEEACASFATLGRQGTSCVGEDPALDQFMEAYCEMLTKYEQELSKPFKEAMLFLSRIECQFKSLSVSPMDSACGEAMDRNGSSEEDVEVNNSTIDPLAEDHELKGQLLRKYSGYLGSLKQEFMKKRKKGKLPKEARQQLLDWWSTHYKWPYPSEAQKLSLAESTGLDQKQINNWFINQRKRHWKPSEDMQFVVMDAMHHNFYMDNVLGNPFPTDMSATFL